MHIRKLYRIFSMRRGGQHVFVDWLLEQTRGTVLFINDVSPEQNLEQKASCTNEFDKFFQDGVPTYLKTKNLDAIIVNYEDWPLDASIIQSVSSNITADHVTNILLLRDPLNLFASRYFFWSRMPINAERWQWNDTQLWINHAMHYLGKIALTDTAELIPVNFNAWISDRNQRIELSSRLGLKFSDDSIQSISHVGSQFDTKRVNARWQIAAEIPEYQSLFTNELITLSKSIFSNHEDITDLQGFQQTPMPDVESIYTMFTEGNIRQAQYNAIRLCHNVPLLNHWSLLAGIYAQQGSFDDVIACCHKMLAIDPGNISTKYNLALAFQELNRFDEARFIYDEILLSNPEHAATAINLSNIYIKIRDFDKAHRLLNDLTKSGNTTFELCNTVGILAMEEKDYVSAIEQFNKAITLNNNSITPYLNMSRCLASIGESEKAKAMLNEIIQSQQLDDHSVQIALAFVYRQSTNFSRALKILQDEQSNGRHSLDLYMEMGQVYREMDEYEKSAQAYQMALSINHAYERTLNNIGAVYMLARDYTTAEQYFRQSISINSEYAEAHWNLAWVCLTLCKFSEGWKEYEWRFSVGVAERLEYEGIIEWNGQDLQGKKILLYVEQGYGDAIHFIRYCKLLSESGASVSVLCDRAIGSLLACADGVESVISKQDINVDYYAPLLSVPHILQYYSIPFSTPYVKPDYSTISSDLVSMLAGADKNKLRIGIAWCGNPGYPEDQRRSCSIEHFTALAKRDDVALYSLQKGDAARDIDTFSMRRSIVDMDSMINNFTDTAYIVSRLDLVIAVDTSVAHLSGAIGCETWVLLRYSGDWRWHSDESESQWYASTKIFRQTTPRNWSEVFSSLEQSLDELSSL